MRNRHGLEVEMHLAGLEVASATSPAVRAVDRAPSRAHPGFMVMKKPTRGSRDTVLPSVKTKDFLRSRIAERMQ